MSVGENIRSRREALGLSQVQVAAEAGIAQSMLCQIERGTKNPSLQVSMEIARILKCNVEDLANKEVM